MVSLYSLLVPHTVIQEVLYSVTLFTFVSISPPAMSPISSVSSHHPSFRIPHTGFSFLFLFLDQTTNTQERPLMPSSRPPQLLVQCFHEHSIILKQSADTKCHPCAILCWMQRHLHVLYSHFKKILIGQAGKSNKTAVRSPQPQVGSSAEPDNRRSAPGRVIAAFNFTEVPTE